MYYYPIIQLRPRLISNFAPFMGRRNEKCVGHRLDNMPPGYHWITVLHGRFVGSAEPGRRCRK